MRFSYHPAKRRTAPILSANPIDPDHWPDEWRGAVPNFESSGLRLKGSLWRGAVPKFKCSNGWGQNGGKGGRVSSEWRSVKANFVENEWFETLQTRPESSPEERQDLLAKLDLC